MRGPAEFSRYVYDLLKEHFPDRELELDPVNHTIHAGEARFGMSNLYIEFQQGQLSESEAKQALIANFRRAFEMLDAADTMLPDKWEDVESRLRVQLANASLRELNPQLSVLYGSSLGHCRRFACRLRIYSSGGCRSLGEVGNRYSRDCARQFAESFQQHADGVYSWPTQFCHLANM